MTKRPTGDIKETDLRLHIESLQEESLENILTLAKAPTASTPLLLDKQVGKNGSDLYFRVGKIIFKVTATSTITVT